MTVADVVIVGAGSAGCALAARLSEEPGLSVVLLEAGQVPRNLWVDVPIGYFRTVGHPRLDWRFETEADPDMNDRRIPWPRGKGLGGTSLINGMLYLRGHRSDYDQWAALGNPGWSWQEVLPYFERAEQIDGGAGHAGSPGTLPLVRIPPDELSDAFIAAAGSAGIPFTEDFNTGENLGAGYFRMTARRGRRMSTYKAYLGPARGRGNLRVITGAHAARVVTDRHRAVGVEVIRNGVRERITARREVVLCAGAIQSPQLLQLSGIGDPGLLQRHGIAVVAALPGVGSNLQDHLQVRPSFRCRGVETLNDIAHSPWRGARELLRYVLFRSGALSWGVYRAGAFFRAGPGAGWPDAQIHFGLVSFDRPLQPPHDFPGITLSACILRPESRGTVQITSTDPLAAPAIQAGYLSSEADRDQALRLVRRMREIAAQPALARYIVREHEPGDEVVADAQILDWARRRASSIFHPVGTCSMGPAHDPAAVVDARLRVHGIDGLRVVDGSVMPRITSGNTNAPIIMIAEHASSMMRADLAAGQ